MADSEPAAPTMALSRLQRRVAGVVGVALLASGSVAVYITKNEVGSTALLLSGVAIFLAGVLDLNIQRLKLGSGEIEMVQRVRMAQELEERGQDDAAEQVLQSLLRPRSLVKSAVGTEEVREAYRTAVIGHLEQALPTDYDVVEEHESQFESSPFEATISYEGWHELIGMHISIEPRLPHHIRRVLRAAISFNEDPEIAGVLVVVPAPLVGQSGRLVAEAGRAKGFAVEVVVWNVEDDPPTLYEAVHRIVAAVSTETRRRTP